MRIAILLLLVTIGSVVYNFTTPFHFDAIGSNWSLIDFTVYVTFVICGAAFVLLGILMAWWVYKFQYQEGKYAEYEPENATLESRLTIITTIGVVVMLAPGLVAWNYYINVPPEAYELEVLSEQWKWSYRFPGEDGIFGAAHNKYVDLDNPFGMKEDDPYGEDDVLIPPNHVVKIPIDRPVKVLLRSKDVLHDFWVPAIRAKMDAVPGMVTYFWFEPIREQEYEILCAELCGRGHHQMRGEMHVVSLEEYGVWLNDQVTWAEMRAGVVPLSPEAQRGREVASSNGCFACHSIDGSAVVGPTWLDIWGGTVVFDDGTTRIRDEAYIIKSILDPHAQIVKGYSAEMTTAELELDDMQSIVEYIKVLKSEPPELDSTSEDILDPVDDSLENAPTTD